MKHPHSFRRHAFVFSATLVVWVFANLHGGCGSCIKTKLHPKAQENSDLCAKYYEEGKLEQAEARCKIAIEYSPEFAQPYNTLGLIEKARGRPEKAMEYFKQAISLNDDFAEAHCNIGTMWEAKRDYQMAAEAYKTGIEIDPGYVGCRQNMAKTYFLMGKMKEAQSEYLKCTELDANNCDCRSGLGMVALSEKDLVTAREHYQKLVQICPADPKNWYNLGYVEFVSSRCEKAIIAFTNALAINRDMLEARDSLVKAYECVAMSNAALAAHIGAVNRNPRDPQSHFKLGLVFQEQEMYEQALSEFLVTIRLDPNHKLAYYHAARMYDRQLLKDQTIAFCKQFVNLLAVREHPQMKDWCVKRVKALEFE